MNDFLSQEMDTALRRTYGVPEVPSGVLVKLAAERVSAMTELDIGIAASLAKTAFSVAGWNDGPEYKVFSTMERRPAVTPGSVELARVVYRAVGRMVPRALEKAAESAGAAILKGTLPALQTVMKTLALVGLGTGAVAGGGLWALRRGGAQEDEKARKLEIQRDTYRRLASEVRDEMRRRNLAATPDNVAATTDYLT